MRRTTIFSSYKKTLILQPETDVEEIIKSIQQGCYSLYVNAAREAGKGTEQYEKIKCIVPSFTPHGSFKGAKNNDLEALSGLVYLDIDNQEVDLEDLKSITSLYACWKSISGTGYSLLFRAEGFTAEQLNDCIKSIAREYSLPFDNNAKSLNRAVVISSDADVYHNPDAVPFWYWEEHVEEAPMQVSKPETKSRKNKTLPNNFLLVQDLPVYAAKPYEFAEDEIYTLYDEPVYTVELFKQRIAKGRRHDTLKIIAGKIVAIYSTQKHSEGAAYEQFLKFNLLCEEPLQKEELNKIFNRTIAELKAGTLAVSTQMRRGKINPAMSEAVKKAAPGMMNGEIRKKRTRSEILEAIQTLQVEGKKIRQKDVARHIGKSLETIKRYWKEFKTMVREHNSNPGTQVKEELRKAA